MVTIHDVARVAEVSISTVSRALATPDVVAEATRVRVERAAEQLGYQPNPQARSLITGRTHCIGLVVPDLENPFFASICKGVQASARRRGYTVFVADTDEDVVTEAEIIRNMTTQVDGLLLCSVRGTDAAVRKLIVSKPVIILNRRIRGVPSVTFNDRVGIEALVEHLADLGHRHIVYAGGPSTSRSHRQRLQAFEAIGRSRAGLQLVPLGEFPPYMSGGALAADAARDSGATAVIAFNDLMALGIVDRFREQGIAVPDDISVAGVDNVAVSTLARPHLTTVNLPRGELARLGVDWLLDIVLGGATPPVSARRIAVELVTRDSTAPPMATRSDRTRSTELITKK